MAYDEVLELPLRVFTLYNSSISRLRAEEDMRLLRILSSANNGEVANDVFNELQDHLGTTIETEGERIVEMETDALDKLKSMQNIR